jgi:hypothetical protein
MTIVIFPSKTAQAEPCTLPGLLGRIGVDCSTAAARAKAVGRASFSGMVGLKTWDVVRRLGARASSLVVLSVLFSGACAGKSTGGADTQAGDPCPGFCEKARKCPQAPAFSGTCDDFCLQQDAVAEATNCHDTYQQSLTCSAALSDACSATTTCLTQLQATYNCEVAYCNAHKSNEICAYVM